MRTLTGAPDTSGNTSQTISRPDVKTLNKLKSNINLFGTSACL